MLGVVQYSAWCGPVYGVVWSSILCGMVHYSVWYGSLKCLVEWVVVSTRVGGVVH